MMESRELYKKTFLCMSNAVLILDMEKPPKILECNPATTQVFGYTRDELVGRTADILEAEDSLVDGYIEHVLQTDESFSHPRQFEHLMRRKNGQVFPSEYTISSINDGKDTPIGRVSVISDISDRNQAQERINRLKHTLNSLRNINQLITREKDLDRLIDDVCNSLVESRSCGTAWIVLTTESLKPVTHIAVAGLDNKKSPVSDSWKQAKLPQCFRKALRQDRAVITRNRPKTCIACPVQPESTDAGCITVRIAHGINIYGILSASMPGRKLSDGDEVAIFQELAADIAFAAYSMELEDENKLLEQERLRAAKLETVSTLAGGIAHDFNNLLTGIMGNIGASKMLVDPNEKIYAMMDEAEKAAGRARNLTQQLLTFAREGKPVKESVRINELIKDSATFALRGSDVRLELSLPGELWSVEVDEGQINQVIQNLVINADEAMPDGGILRIRAENIRVKKASGLPIRRGDYIMVEIKDTGTGILRKNLGRIFRPYYTTKQKGTGLGLSTAYSIVKNHGGYIVAESIWGKGTTFRIYIPASVKPAEVRKKLVMDNKTTAGGCILIMDDEEIIRNMLSNMLHIIGYESEVAADGSEAVEKYSQAINSGKPYQAVIMDLTVPGGMGGKEAVRKLLEIDPHAKVIVSSGYATDTIMFEYKKYGFAAVIAKPYSVSEVEETLNSLFGNKPGQ